MSKLAFSQVTAQKKTKCQLKYKLLRSATATNSDLHSELTSPSFLTS